MSDGADWLDSWQADDPPKKPEPLLGWKAVHRAVGYSRAHIHRLEGSGDFPNHLWLAGGRVVWLQKDIMAWMQARMDERKHGAPIAIVPGDRFVLRREMKEVIPYSIDHLTKLEARGVFPGRIPLGPKRVGWLERELAEWIEKLQDDPGMIVPQAAGPGRKHPS
jgi:prophage regulatory protein